MYVKNEYKLRKKHPNYDREIRIIVSAVNSIMKIILDKDVYDFAESLSDAEWEINRETFFGGKPKGISYESKKYGGFTCWRPTANYDGIPESKYHGKFLQMLAETDLFDSLTFENTFTEGHFMPAYEIRFSGKGFYGKAGVNLADDDFVLISYEFT